MFAPILTIVLAASACSAIGGDDDPDDGLASGSVSKRVVLVTHESFVLPEELQKKFEQDTGYQIEVRASGDAGALTNKLVLTKDKPLGDAAFGVDNTFASRALDEGVFAPYAAKLPEGADEYLLDGDDDQALTPIDNGSVCVNIDDTWFADHDLAPPTKVEQLKAALNRFLHTAVFTSCDSMGDIVRQHLWVMLGAGARPA